MNMFGRRLSVYFKRTPPLINQIATQIKPMSTTTDLGKPGNVNPVVHCYNEWDPLEEVIVGRTENACVPPPDPEVLACVSESKWGYFKQNQGRLFPAAHMAKAKEEIEEVCNVLEQEGVIVQRPDIVDWTKGYETPDFKSICGLHGAMPRDILMVIGDEIIEAPMAWRSRFFEYIAYRSLMKKYFKAGAKWTTAPKPQMSDELYDNNFLKRCEEENGRRAIEGKMVITEFEPCFDTADFTRAGKDIFVQKSHVTNMFGIEWLARHIGPEYNVHVLTLNDPSPMHIDASFVLLKPGLVLVHPGKPCDQVEMFRKAGWKLIEAPAPVISEGLQPIPLEIKHANSIGGGFHCWTCDIRRNGKLESYF